MILRRNEDGFCLLPDEEPVRRDSNKYKQGNVYENIRLITCG